MNTVVLILVGLALAAALLAAFERRRNITFHDETRPGAPQTEADRQAIRTQSEMNARVHGSGGMMF